MVYIKIVILLLLGYSNNLLPKAILFFPDTTAQNKDIFGSTGIFFKTIKASNKHCCVVAFDLLNDEFSPVSFVNFYAQKHKSIIIVVCGAFVLILQDLLKNCPSIDCAYTFRVSKACANDENAFKKPVINLWTKGDGKSLFGGNKLYGNNVINYEILAEHDRGDSFSLFFYEYYLCRQFSMLPKYVSQEWLEGLAIHIGEHIVF